MSSILITGGTGLIGAALTPILLESGFDVTILTRRIGMEPVTKGLSYARWDPKGGWIDEQAIAGADHIIHLAGANVGEKRWTKRRKKEIVESRVDSGVLLLRTLQRVPNNIKSIITASGIGWYGPDTALSLQQGFRENEEVFDNFLGLTCKEWEEALEPVRSLGKRFVVFRQGIVLSNAGGALPEFKRPIGYGIAPVLGKGSQVISWIHIIDLCRMYCFALKHEIEGIYNAVAPAPVSNRSFTLLLAKKMKGRFFLPVRVPSFLLKTALGELSVEVLKSATVSCEKIMKEGFEFRYPSIGKALDDLLGENRADADK